MADRRIEILSRVDQGTVFMLCLTIGIAIIVTIYFVCRWHNKRTQKLREAARIAEAKKCNKKDRVKQTFSRFSQVDEELTMTHIDDDDLELLQSCQSDPSSSKKFKSSKYKNEAASLSVEIGIDDNAKPKNTSGKPYLETDI